MALLIRSVSRRLTRQPQRPLEIDRGTRAGQVISNLIPFGPVNRDIVTGAVLTLAGGGSSIADPGGLALRGSGASAAASIPLDLSSYNQIALSFWLYWDAYANDDKLAMEHGTNFATSHGFLIDPNSGAPFAGSFQIGSNGLGRSFTRPSAAGWHHYFCHLRSQGGAGTDVVSVHVDGVAQSLSASAGSPSSTNFGNNTLYLFSRAGSSLIGAGRLRNLVVRPAFEATSEEIRKEFEKPWALYRVPAKRRYVQIGGASTLSLTPDVAALTLTGYAPTVSQTTTLALTPSTAALTLTGFAPTVTLTTSLTPGVGALTLTGHAPTVTQSSVLALTPDPAALTLAGYAPTVSQTANLSLTPDPAALTLTGYAPAITQTTTLELTPGASALTLTGYAPVVTQGTYSDTMVRPGLDVATTGWASSTGGTLVGAINETAASDAEYVYRPVAGTEPFDFELWLAGVAHSLPAGSHVVRMRADVTAGAAQARLLLLDAGNNVVGTGAWQPLTPGLVTTTFTVDSTATATKGRIEAVAA